jgi:hypothetical protein
MEMPFVNEPIAGNGYRAIGAGGLGRLSTDAATAAEGIDRLADQVRLRVDSRVRVTELNVAGGPVPWQQDAGDWRDDPLCGPWRAAMEEYRRRLDEDPDTP